MPRDKIPYPSKDRWKEIQDEFKKRHGFDFGRKPRYLVDESLGVGTADLLRRWGQNVKDVYQVGIAGQPDENVFQHAQRERRIILTHDDDFLNNSAYPLKGCHGVAVFPFGDGGDAGLIKALAHFVGGTSHAGIIYETKVKIGEKFTWTVFVLGDDGRVNRKKYDLSDPHHVFEIS